MSLATAIQTVVSLGGGLKLIVGTWTGTIGDAAGTITVPGTKVFGAAFLTQDTNGYWLPCPWQDATGTTGTTVITVHNDQTVVDGRFWVLVM